MSYPSVLFVAEIESFETRDVNFRELFSRVKNLNTPGTRSSLGGYLSSADTDSKKNLRWALLGAAYRHGCCDE